QVILRFGDDDARTLAIIARLQADGVAYAGGARWRGLWVMRLSVIGWPTTDDDAVRTADAIVTAFRANT
ncbi:MAG: aspartate aminotransferase family protein, partial [Alphaproteobacteria bacterium]